MRIGLAALGLALSLALGGGTARAAERAQFGQSDAVVLNPQKSYIFFRAVRRENVFFVRDVSEAERSAWGTERAKAYEKARARYLKELVIWEREDRDYRKAGGKSSGLPLPIRPDPVTPETFDYPAPEVSNMRAALAGPQFTKAKDSYSYLLAVEPGTYTLYGQMEFTENGPVGTCLCMGSLKFAASAGQIVDLGEIHFPALEASEAERATRRRLPSHALVPFNSSMAVPERLAGLPLVPADFHAAGKMPNFYGTLIDRLPAIPGILAYQRDRAIDLKTEAGDTAGSPAR